MKVLHTSDLHFGSTLNDLSRLEEHERFLDWLEGKIEEWDIDVLLLSGDIYDSSNPSSAARRLFFRLLHNLRQGARPRRVIVIGGNHDSPAVLNAPAPYLRLDGITVIGRASGDPAREVVPVTDRDGAVRLIVCAVPYLRESDLPRSAFGDDPTGAGRELAAGVLAHYAAVREAALEVERTLPAPVPLAAMGHLFARGVSVDAKDLDGEGPMVGSLGGVDAGPLAGAFDYTALGHIHAPQRVAGSEFARYSGSPLVMDFGERRHEKQVLLVTFEDDAAAEPSPASGWRGRVSVEAVPVPAFRRLVRVTGEDFKKMRKEVAALAKAEAQTPADLPTWVLADYKGPTPPPADWREQLSDAAVPKGGTEPAFVFAIMRDSSPRSLSIMH
ncbi:MAG: exonuclease subunit SbcD, partial [Desulfovibrionaceae bacterium]|nr:exonuclease subunit SbcD [Desulfovibrionaceae bacterium]